MSNDKRIWLYLLKLEEAPGFDFVDSDGETLYLDYSKVNWKSLAKDLTEHMGKMPASMKVYVGDEPLSMTDIAISINYPQGPALFGEIFKTLLNRISSKDCYAGVLDLKKNREILHPVPEPVVKMSPAIGLILALKTQGLQILDHEKSFAEAFGHPPVANLFASSHMASLFQGEGNKQEPGMGVLDRQPMKPEVQEILSRHLMIPYDLACRLTLIGSREA